MTSTVYGIILPISADSEHKRIDALIKEIFYIPPSGESYFNETLFPMVCIKFTHTHTCTNYVLLIKIYIS